MMVARRLCMSWCVMCRQHLKLDFAMRIAGAVAPVRQTPKARSPAFRREPASPLTTAVMQEDSQTGKVQLHPVTHVEMNSMEQTTQRLQTALQCRSIASTGCNPMSSRAHTVFQLHLTLRDRPLKGRGPLHSTLTFVDLAGSERLSQSNAAGLRACESASYNATALSLLLGSCLGFLHTIGACTQSSTVVQSRGHQN